MTDHDLDPTLAASLAHATEFLELAELLQFLAGWLASDPDLAASLSRFVGNPSYDLYKLRVDLDRFAILLGADGDEPPLREQR